MAVRTVICFDVSEGRRRYRLVRLLLGCAERVQKSVFEARELNEAAFLRLRSRAERLIDPATDSLRYYRLCGACLGRAEHFGAGPGLLEAPADFRMIGP
ncbi:MAG: CRISPR-associated endonuclease Cas2 [Myxococcota bacterium]|nr:CRISPR-associated endonuclease Cas2 [Myxococcota bacterium]